MQRSVALPLGALAIETDNLRAALRYFLDRGEAEAGLGLAARIYHLWSLLGPREEGRDWLRRLLNRPATDPGPSRAAALFAAGWLAKSQGDLAEARAVLAEAGPLAQARRDLPGDALSRAQLGVVAWLQGDLSRARGDLADGVQLAREVNAPAQLLGSLAHLGNFALAQRDLAGARAALAEGRSVLPRFPVLGFLFNWLAGGLALASGEAEQAAREYQSAIADRQAAGDPVGVAISALGLAEVAARAGDGARAARLLGGAEGIALGVGGGLVLDEPVQWAQHPRVEAAARELLGEERFAALRAEGRQLSASDVEQLALAAER
jgi:non-specific serine/threonine protein kinase